MIPQRILYCSRHADGASNITFDQTAGSRALATAGQRERSPQQRSCVAELGVGGWEHVEGHPHKAPRIAGG
jgi:hypothetical protein